MSVKVPVSKRLKEARKKAGISQKNLGIAAGIDEFSASARMNQYETGKHIPDYLTLARIAKVLKIPTAFFYADDNTLAKLIQKINQLSNEEKKKLLKFVEKF